jgi:hypothetical protein
MMKPMAAMASGMVVRKRGYKRVQAHHRYRFS